MGHVPWATRLQDFLDEAAATPDGACCLFAIDDSIPEAARAGYGTLILAYAREGEPVTILTDGTSVLLIKEGGVSAGEVAARRVISQMARIGLDHTLRAAVALIGHDVDGVIARARRAALAAAPGEVGTAA